MELVVDTSVIVAVLLEASEKQDLVEMTVGFSLLAPSSVHWEIGNAFSAMLRRKRLNPADVPRLLDAYEKIPIRYVDVGLAEALEFTKVLRLYAYDGYVLACAERQRAPLLTLDRGMKSAAKKSGITLMEMDT